MRALSIKQPWARAIVVGRKIIECRDWTNPYRGLVFIHASKTLSEVAPFSYVLGPNETGAIIGYAYLKEIKKYRNYLEFAADKMRHYCIPLDQYEWNVYGWVFHAAYQLPEPVPCRGWPKLWTPDSGTINAVRRQKRETDNF